MLITNKSLHETQTETEHSNYVPEIIIVGLGVRVVIEPNQSIDQSVGQLINRNITKYNKNSMKKLSPLTKPKTHVKGRNRGQR